MPNKPQRFRFLGRLEDDIVIGDRVQLQEPVAPPPLSADLRIGLDAFQQFFADLRQSLLDRHGQDCADFELQFAPDGSISVIFTRPMDLVEQTQITVHRQQLAPGNAVRSAGDQPPRAVHRPHDRLPDPAAA